MKIKLGKGGFSFTELSLVLTLTGLLAGGVLKGETLVEGFKLQSIMNDLRNINVAYCMYFNRYGELPGDDSQNHGWNSVSVGNRNGIIEGSSTKDGNEAHEAWQSLRVAGFITGDPKAKGKEALPLSPYGGRYYLSHKNFEGSVGKRNCIVVDNLTGNVAEMVDDKYDDGVYNTGDIRASASYVSSNVDLYYAMWL